jgi:hypothetical protein
MLEIMLERMHDKYPEKYPSLINLSRLYLYYWERNFEARLGQEGAYMQDIFEVLQNKGVCTEANWPYETTKQNIQPPVECDTEAQTYKIKEYQNLIAATTLSQWEIAKDKTISNIKHAVCQGRPVCIGMNVTQSFNENGRTIKDWKKFDWDPSKNSLGGHAVVIIGFDDAVQRFLVQNSWGSEWGDGGFFGIPYSYFGKWFIINSAWTVTDNVWFGGPIKVEGYIKKVYDPARQQVIFDYVSHQLQSIKDAAIQYNVASDEIDVAMKWPAGTWDIVKKV